MQRNTGIFFAILWGIFFESLLAPSFGFYIVPVFLAIAIFVFFPFTALALAAVSMVFGFLAMEGWALERTGLVQPSLMFTLHIILFLTVLTFLLYVASEKK